eukprot:9471659-Pyramimonas_sp.AAC.2
MSTGGMNWSVLVMSFRAAAYSLFSSAPLDARASSLVLHFWFPRQEVRPPHPGVPVVVFLVRTLYASHIKRRCHQHDLANGGYDVVVVKVVEVVRVVLQEARNLRWRHIWTDFVNNSWEVANQETHHARGRVGLLRLVVQFFDVHHDRSAQVR